MDKKRFTFENNKRQEQRTEKAENHLQHLQQANIKNAAELEFAVFCIENIALRLEMDAKEVYQALTEKSDILNGYIIPEYEILHTQSKEYIVDDILELMYERGVAV